MMSNSPSKSEGGLHLLQKFFIFKYFDSPLMDIG